MEQSPYLEANSLTGSQLLFMVFAHLLQCSFPLCLLLDKPHLFSLTQHRFILIQVISHACMLLVLNCT